MTRNPEPRRPGKVGRRAVKPSTPVKRQRVSIWAESLEARTLLTSTPLNSAQIQALIGTVDDAAQTGGGLATLREWGASLNGSKLFAQPLPIVDQSVGQLIDVGAQFGSQLLTPATAYLATANPTAEGLIAALQFAESANGASGANSDTFSNNSGIYSFILPSLTTSVTVQTPIDLGDNASLLNVNADRSGSVSLTTTLALNLSFSLDTTRNNLFSVALKSSTLTASINSTLPNLSVNLGIIGGQVQGGNLALTAGLDFGFSGGQGATVAQLIGDESSLSSLVTVTPSLSSSLSATLPLSVTLNGKSLASGSTPTITVADSHPFDGTAPTVSTANFANLVSFMNLTPSALLSDLANLGTTLSSLSNSPFFSTPLPFAGGTTVGDAVDFGKAFADKVVAGLGTISPPSQAATVGAPTGGAAVGQLAAGTYFVEYTFGNANGHSAPSPLSAPFTVTAGQIPQITLPAAPDGQTIDLYLSDSKATAGSATLYKSAIAGGLVALDSAAPSGGLPAPTAASRTPLFGSAQALATLLGQALATSPGSPLQVNPTFVPASGSGSTATPNELTFTITLDDQLASLVVPLDFNLSLGALGGISTTAKLQIMPEIKMGLTFGINLDPMPASLSGGASARALGADSKPLPIPSNGQLGADSTFTLTIGSTPHTVTLPKSSTDGDTSIDNPNNRSDPTTLVGQINLALKAAGVDSLVAADFVNGNITLTLQNFGQGTSLKLDFADGDPMGSVVGFTSGLGVHAKSGDLFIQNASANGSLILATTTDAGATSFATASVGPLSLAIGTGTASAIGSIGLLINGGNPISLGQLASDFTTLAGIKQDIAVTPSASFTANLTGLTISAGGSFSYTPSAPPSLTVIALDPIDEANQLTVAPATKGQLGGDLYFRVTLGGATSTIHIPASAMAANRSVSDLVGEINAALLAAYPSGQVQATLAAGTGQISFTTSTTSTLAVDHFVSVAYQNFDDLANFKNLGIGDVANAIQQAVSGLSQYSSLGFLAQKLPIINKSVVDLVDYGAAFANQIQQLQTDPNASLQLFGDALGRALGLPQGALSLGYDPANKALKIQLTYQPLAYDQYLNLDLDLAALAQEATSPAAQAALQGLSSVVDLSGRSHVHVQAAATLTLDLGIGLNPSGTPTAFLYNDTGVQLTALLAAQNVSFDASLGPLALSIQGGSAILSVDGKSTSAPATFTLGISKAAGNPTLSDFLTHLGQDTAVILKAGASLNLPISLAGLPLGSLSAAIPDVGKLLSGTPNSVTLTTPDLGSQLKKLGSLSTLLENPQVFLQPLNSLLGGLQTTLNSQLADSLPLIGGHLKDAAHFIADIQNDIVAPIAAAIKAGGNNPVQAVADAMQQALRAIDKSATVTVFNSPDGKAVQFDIQLGGDENFSTPFDLGLSALGLGLNGSVNFDFKWAVNLDVGISSTDGFYVVANPTVDPGDPNSKRLQMVSAALAVTLPGTQFNGSLVFLNLSATNNPANAPGVTVPGDPTTPANQTGLFGTLTVNLSPSGAGPDAHLKLSDISGSSLKNLVDAELAAQAWVNLHLVTSVGNSAMFPSFSTDFVVDWPIGQYRFGQGGSLGTSPKVAFENVGLDLGGFISSFVGPILSKIKPIFDAVKPVVDTLTQRIPVISDLAGQDITLAGLAETLDPKDAPSIHAFLDDYQTLYNLINSIPTDGSSLTIQFGSFDLAALIGDLRGLKSLKTTGFDQSKLPSFKDLTSQLNNAPAGTKSFVGGISKTGGSLEFPILSNPASVLQLLMGQTIDLFTYSTPTLTLAYNYTQEFPIFGPLVAELGGNVGASLHFAFGYDTYGIQEWAHAGFAASQAAPDLLDGFYAVADGPPNIVLNAGIFAGAGIDLGIVSGGVDGGIFATIDMTLNSPDGSGKLRLDQFIAELSTPLSIFDVSGKVYAQLFAHIKLGFGPFSISKTFNITPEINLVTFDTRVAPAPPVLADLGGDGSLTLNTGSRSSDRGSGNTNQGDQSFTVHHGSGQSGQETVTVTAYGQTSTYTGVKKIVAQGGLGDDTIDLTGVQSDATITGGQGHNTIIGGSGRNTLVEDQFSSYNLVGGQLIMDGANSDTFSNIQQVQLTGQTGGQASFNLKGYVGDSTLTGQGGNNSFNVDLSPDGLTKIVGGGNLSGGDNATITLADGQDATMTRTQLVQGVNTIDYSGDPGLASLTVNGTASNTRYIIQDTPAGPVQTTLNTGDGNDTVDVEATSGTTTINTGAGTTGVIVGSQASGTGGVLSGIQGPLTVATAIGIVSVVADDSGDPSSRSATLTATTLNGLGMGSGGITYANLTGLNVHLGGGGDSVNVRGTAAYNTTTITALNAETAATTVNVGSASPNSGGTVSAIAGPLIFAGSGRDALNLDDSGDTAAAGSLLVTSTTLTGLGMASLQGITYSGLTALNVALGTGGDTVSILSTSGPTTTTIRGASRSSSNTFDVGSLAPKAPGGVLGGIAGPLVILGSGSDTLNADNTGDATFRFGTLTDTTLTGLGMGTSGITFGGLGVFSLNLGTGGNAFSVTVQNNLPALSTVTAGTPTDTATTFYAHNLNGVLNLIGFATAPSAHIVGNLYGNLNLTQYQVVPTLVIDGSVEPNAVITGVNIGRMTVGGSFYGELDLMANLGEVDIRGDMTGLINVAGTLQKAVIQGGTPGQFVANRVGTIATSVGYGPVPLQVREAGVERRVEFASPSNPYPLASPLKATNLAPIPGQPTFKSMYEGFASDNGLGGAPTAPQITWRVIQPVRTVASQQYDLSFTTWDDAAKFNLARLDATDASGNPAASGLRDVAVEGDLLTRVSPEAIASLGLASNQGGIRLPSDSLAGVAVRDYAPQRDIQASSIQSVAFGSFSQDNGKVLDGGSATLGNAGELLAATTAYAQAKNGTNFRIPFADKHPVALFFVSLAGRNVFDGQDIVFTKQGPNVPVAGAVRGDVTALVSTSLALAGPGVGAGSTYRAQVGRVALNGDGGSFSTGQWVNGPITSTGPLGDITLSDSHGLTGDITAPSIFGNILALSGPIAGTIRTTGLRTDPITGATATVAADIGQVNAGPSGSYVATRILAGSGGLTGRIISGGNLVSQVTSYGPITGTIAAGGNIGITSGGVRYGGIVGYGLLSGQVEALGSLIGDVSLQGGMAGGQIAVRGSILGNLNVNGPFDARSRIVAGGSIGDASFKTALTFGSAGSTGMVAAKGAVRISSTSGSRPSVIYQNLPSGPNASAVDALFAQLASDLAADSLNGLVGDPTRLKVVNGSLIFGP